MRAKHILLQLVMLIMSSLADQGTVEDQANLSDFMPSHQVLFSKSDGELLLPALTPYTGNLQSSASTNSINNLLYSRPSYASSNQQQQSKATCLLRTCDQYVTGRDLTYQRALEIVQNEEYLVAVDADLIRRRQGYESQTENSNEPTENFGTSWTLTDHQQLAQYLASAVGKRKKREAENNPLDDEWQSVDPEARFIYVNGSSGYGSVNYDWSSVADQYIKFGAATALLFGLASYLPAPAEPILPVNLASLSSKKSNVENEEPSLAEKSIYQVYQEDAPQRLSDKKFMKRFDLLAAFRPKQKARPRPAKRPGQAPSVILKPVTNTKKRQVAKIPQVAKAEADEEAVSIKQSEIDLDGDLQKNPFLSELEFKEFFPSWSESGRKKRATVVTEGRIFNITSSGFGTVTYDWRDVFGTYLGYFVTGGLILAAASILTVPARPLIPLDLPSFGEARINPSSLGPNLPEGLVPPGYPLPGTVGGGARPVGNTPDAREAIALVPSGTIPVAIFPPYGSARTVPSVSVIFLETATPGLVKRQGLWDLGTGFDSLSRSYNCMKAKIFRKKRSPQECQNYDHLRYGFRSRVSLVENQSCIMDVTCTATGDRINIALSKRRGPAMMSQRRMTKRQSSGEFLSDAPPSCRAIRDPNNTCHNYLI